MALCVQADVNGVLSVASPQPADISACTMMVIAPSDLMAGPWVLSEEQAVEITGAILMVWAVAWGVRVLIRALRFVDDDERETA